MKNFLFLLVGLAVLGCGEEEELIEDFDITISQEILSDNELKGIVISDQKGKIFYSERTADLNKNEDLHIVLPRPKNAYALTLISKYSYTGPPQLPRPTTFNNLEDGTRVENYSSLIPSNQALTFHILDPLEIKVSGIQSLEDILILNRNNIIPEYELIDDYLIITFGENYSYYYNNAPISILIKANQEEVHRYLYSKNHDINSIISYNDLSIDYTTRDITLPYSDTYWRGKVYGFNELENEFTILANLPPSLSSGGTFGDDVLKLYFPTSMTMDHYSLSIEDPLRRIHVYMNRIDELPSSISEVTNTIENLRGDRFSYNFEINGSFKYHLAIYDYGLPMDGTTYLYYWYIYGKDANISFVLPEIPNDILSQFDVNAKLDNAVSLQVLAYDVSNLNEIFWKTPYKVTNQWWRKTKNYTTVSEQLFF